MYLMMREYRVDPASMEEIARRAGEGFVPIVSAVSGFVSLTLVDFGGGAFATFSIFEDKSGADESVAKAAGFVRENLSSLAPNPPQVTPGEVVFRDAKAGQQATYGVLRLYQADLAKVEEIVRRVRDGLLPIVRQVPGYVSYLAIDQGNGRLGSASTFTDQAASEESTRSAADWIRSNLAPLLPNPPEVRSGRILVRHMAD